MKRLLVAAVLAAALTAGSAQKASAWCKFNFGVGLNIGLETGGAKRSWVWAKETAVCPQCAPGCYPGGPGPGPGFGAGFGAANPAPAPAAAAAAPKAQAESGARAISYTYTSGGYADPSAYAAYYYNYYYGYPYSFAGYYGYYGY
jgi:hypothetical protein